MPAEIPFYSLHPQNEQIKKEVHQVLNGVFDSAWYVLGEQVERFEQAYASYIGVKHCIGVGNGLDALKISLKALGLGRGDEVLVPAHTYIATVLAVSETGATPVFIEPDRTYNIDPLKIEEKITARTRAILPVHLYGLPCKMDAILEIAQRYKLFIVEDNAQATGALYKGRKTGSFGHLNAHSFYPTKNLGALGDGGAITTDNDELARLARLYRNYGSAQKYKNEILGYNSRLDEIQAAVLSVKLRYLDEWNQQKRTIALQYNGALSDIPGFFLPAETSPEMTHSYHLYVALSDHRNDLMNHLKKENVQTLIHYPVPPYRQQAYKGQFNGHNFPLTDSLCNRIISLPLFPGMAKEQADRITKVIREFRG